MNPKYAWLCVTNDEYELPIAVADTVQELADMLGVSKGTIVSSISKQRLGQVKRSKYRRIEVEDDEEEEEGGMEDSIKVLFKEPNKPFKSLVIQNDLSAMQFLVDGYIEHLTMWKGLGVIMNDEGKLKRLPPNIEFRGDILVGNLIFVGQDEEDFTDISDRDADILINYCTEI